MEKHKKVYIIASERSGTNLLRKILNESQNKIVGVSPPHFLKHLFYQEPYYGDLSDETVFTEFVSTALKLCEVHYSPWNVTWNVNDLISEYGNRPRNSVTLMDFMYQKYAKELDYHGYICKDNYIFEFYQEIQRVLPDAKFIYLYRDPRDVVLSQIKRPNVQRSVFKASKLWSYEQTRCIRAYHDLAKKSSCISLSYEDLLNDPTNQIDRILRFLDIDRNENSSYEEQTVTDVHEWKNLSSPIKVNNTQKYKNSLTKNQVLIIENICKKQMDFLGYSSSDSTRQISTIVLLDLIRSFISVRCRQLFISNKKVINDRSRVLNKLYINYRSDN